MESEIDYKFLKKYVGLLHRQTLDEYFEMKSKSRWNRKVPTLKYINIFYEKEKTSSKDELIKIAFDRTMQLIDDRINTMNRHIEEDKNNLVD